MKDNEITQVVNDLRDIAIEFHGTQQLRARIARLIVPLLKDGPKRAETAKRRRGETCREVSDKP